MDVPLLITALMEENHFSICRPGYLTYVSEFIFLQSVSMICVQMFYSKLASNFFMAFKNLFLIFQKCDQITIFTTNCFENECMTSVDFRHFIVRLGKKIRSSFMWEKRSEIDHVLLMLFCQGKKKCFQSHLESNLNLKLQM